jgi:hypothetical protein
LVGIRCGGRGRFSIPAAELDPGFKGGKEGHAYKLAMLELGMRTGAATTAALRDDPGRARAELRSLREQMSKAAAMVPSWKPHFRTTVIDELESAVTAKADVATRRKIVSRLESSCTACHARFTFQVQAQYRWGSLADAVVTAESGTLTSTRSCSISPATWARCVRTSKPASFQRPRRRTGG